jgi:hypothetical protein
MRGELLTAHDVEFWCAARFVMRLEIRPSDAQAMSHIGTLET